MTVEQRLDQHDRQIKAIRELVHEGMRLVVQSRKDFRVLAKSMIELSDQQKRTETSLQALTDSLRRGGNGHQKKKLDL